MANGSLSALGLGGALDLRDEGHTQARALAFVDRIQLERLGFELVNSQGPILPHPHPDAAAPESTVDPGMKRVTSADMTQRHHRAGGGSPAGLDAAGRAAADRGRRVQLSEAAPLSDGGGRP